MKKIGLIFLLPLSCFSQVVTSIEVAQWAAQAKRVSIIEDEWGVPHIYGKSDADAVFGLMYVQCSQNFSRVERNYVEMMGRLSEIEGEQKLYDDLQMRLIYDSAAAKADYAKSPDWFKKLLNAFANGVNYYLYKHPDVKPAVLKKFEPWFPLMYTDGSINPTQTGGLTIKDLKNFYEGKDEPTSYIKPELSINNFTPDGSNGFAIAPSRTKNGNAILYINPHVTFYFRTEVHIVSDEGLNAYGAVTWGQFFVYQGFNEHCGWMHTSSYADVADVYEETVINESQTNEEPHYHHKHIVTYPPSKDHRLSKVMQKPVYTSVSEDNSQAVSSKQVQINFKTGDSLSKRTFVTYTIEGHGPVMGKRNGRWLSLKHNNRSLSALMQSWHRTKAKGFQEFKKIMEMRSNNSNNTVFADNKGNIAYWHGNFIPRRNPKYDWTLPADGSTNETDWKGLHTLDQIIHIYSPKSGWIQNCNSTPFTASGASSPAKEKYPSYMAPEGQNGRALNAMRLLSNAKDITLDKIISIGYNTYLSAFDTLLPALFKAYKELPPTDSLKPFLRKPIELLQQWDKHASASSVATTLAIEWATKLATRIPPAKTTEAATNAIGNFQLMATISSLEKLLLLNETLQDLEKWHGTWNIAWGDVNRFQRPVDNRFSDDNPSLPVGLGPGTWGSLPSYVSRRINTNKRYGFSGNSFVAAIEFGKRIKAKTIITGGASFKPFSSHFTDQAQGFIEGKFKDIHFYKEDVLKNAERTYHPGE